MPGSGEVAKARGRMMRFDLALLGRSGLNIAADIDRAASRNVEDNVGCRLQLHLFGAVQQLHGDRSLPQQFPRRRKFARRVRRDARQMGYLRYIVVAVLVAAAVFAPTLGESLNAIEPFKTSITLGFNASWPFVAYALALLLVGAFYFKFFCRFICPLGAAVSLGGKLRFFDWIMRRAECGKPCQLCKIECRYDAIKPTGEIRYDACFQCLDCVAIYHDAGRCVPAVLYEKRKKTLVVRSGE
jgi:NosR/NirI family transcriptional regulator, nitrous oxide reductase regulator